MGINIDTSFRMYYIYKHRGGVDIAYMKPATPEDTIRSWSKERNEAQLFVNEEAAFWIAHGLKQHSLDEGLNFCVGCVKIDVDPFYIPRAF